MSSKSVDTTPSKDIDLEAGLLKKNPNETEWSQSETFADFLSQRSFCSGSEDKKPTSPGKAHNSELQRKTIWQVSLNDNTLLPYALSQNENMIEEWVLLNPCHCRNGTLIELLKSIDLHKLDDIILQIKAGDSIDNLQRNGRDKLDCKTISDQRQPGLKCNREQDEEDIFQDCKAIIKNCSTVEAEHKIVTNEQVEKIAVITAEAEEITIKKTVETDIKKDNNVGIIEIRELEIKTASESKRSKSNSKSAESGEELKYKQNDYTNSSNEILKDTKGTAIEVDSEGDYKAQTKQGKSNKILNPTECKLRLNNLNYIKKPTDDNQIKVVHIACSQPDAKMNHRILHLTTSKQHLDIPAKVTPFRTKFTSSNSSASIISSTSSRYPSRSKPQYRHGSPDLAITRTGLFPVIPRVTGFRQMELKKPER